MSDLFVDPENVDGLFVEDDGALRVDEGQHLTLTVGDESQSFRLADRVGIMAQMQFARIAKQGVRANEMEAMVALLDFIEQALHPDDLPLFTEFTIRTRAEAEEILPFVREAIALISGRPTQPRSSSPGGSRTTSESSPDASSSLVSLPGGKTPGPIMRDPRVLEFRPLSAAI